MIIRSSADTYRKIFLFTTIPFGLVMGLWTGLIAGPGQGLVAGIGGGLVYGFFMALFLGALHQFSTKRLKTDYNESLLGVHQVQVVTIDQSFDDAFLTCQTSLQGVHKWRITQSDLELGVLYAETGMTWKSFGEKIMLTVSSIGNRQCKVIISSKPAISTTLVDYGKNAENVRSIIESLRMRAPISEPQVESTTINAPSQPQFESNTASTPKLALGAGAADEIIETGTTIKLKKEEPELFENSRPREAGE